MPVKLFVGPSEDKTMDITVRPLIRRQQAEGVHHRRQRTTSPTGSLSFAAPIASTTRCRTMPQRRRNGCGSAADGCWWTAARARSRSLKLPDFDPFYSEVSWYRDYAAYCGITRQWRAGECGCRRDRRARSRCFARNWARTRWTTRRTAIAPRRIGSASPRA